MGLPLVAVPTLLPLLFSLLLDLFQFPLEFLNLAAPGISPLSCLTGDVKVLTFQSVAFPDNEARRSVAVVIVLLKTEMTGFHVVELRNPFSIQLFLFTGLDQVGVGENWPVDDYRPNLVIRWQ